MNTLKYCCMFENRKIPMYLVKLDVICNQKGRLQNGKKIITICLINKTLCFSYCGMAYLIIFAAWGRSPATHTSTIHTYIITCVHLHESSGESTKFSVKFVWGLSSTNFLYCLPFLKLLDQSSFVSIQVLCVIVSLKFINMSVVVWHYGLIIQIRWCIVINFSQCWFYRV